ncbi:plasma membrane calcium [Amphichorda felina]
MADSKGGKQPQERAPAITIDTAAENGQKGPANMPEHSQPPQNVNWSPTSQDGPASASDQPGKLPDLHIQTSFDSRNSLPPSPHNVSSPVKSRGNDRSSGFLEVPGSGRDRQGSVDTEDGSRSVSSQGDVTVVPSNGGQSDQGKQLQSHNENIMEDDTALNPDVGSEAEFKVENNPFAFSPGQLSKLFDPKSLAAFYKLGGLAGLERGLRTDRKAGLNVNEGHLSGTVSFDEATRKDVKPLAHAASDEMHVGNAGEPFQDRLRVFKDNRLPERQGKSLLQLMYITMKDKVLILLSIAAVVSLAVGLYQTFSHESGSNQNNDKRELITQYGFAKRVENANEDGSGRDKDSEPRVEWVEGVAIMVAIAIVVLVSSLVDWRKERRFAKLNRKKQDRVVKVIRSGKTSEISVYDIMAGDVLHLEPGDLVPADGILIEGFNIKCDESQATGESDLIRKRPADDVYRAIETHENLKKMDPFIQSGARVTEGIGTYMVTSTGVHSSYGKILMALNDDQDMTPLQHKLNVIAIWIAKIGTAAAFLLFVVLFIKFLVNLPKQPASVTPAQKGQQFLDIFLVIVTIIVVAVPEGLPLAVTLALAYAMVRMIKDNNLVRHLKACEVMGNATTICSDKTGTLTQNEMRVVSGTIGTGYQFGGRRSESPETETGANTTPMDDANAKSAEGCVSMLGPSVKELLLKSIALNSTAFEGEENGQMKFIGSKTETALLLFAKDHLKMGPVEEEREKSKTIQLVPFDSARKAMAIVVQLPNNRARLYVKGASEIILAKCSSILRNPAEDTAIASMTKEDRSTISGLIDRYANRSLRTIGIAYRDFESWPPEDTRRVEGNSNEVDVESLFEDLSFIGMVGIQDPLRPGVPESVALCQKAGVTVRMVTGDNKLTAQAIAKECGILQPDGIVLEGPEFRNMSRLQQEEIIPRLQVLARSSPEDKRILVKRLKDKDEIVAVTGDGTNDAPALTTADVGFSMGQSGTEVAKEASSIILMDDNFVSIVQALKWGRAVNDAVKRFLQFQLTVNITAVVLTFITAVSSDSEESVLTAVQLLWVNLIMDTLAALALATDPPQHSILERKPEPRKNFIITPTMWKMIIGQAIYQLAITLALYYGGPHGILPLGRQPSKDEISTLVFNTFVWMQIFNQWNNRRLDNHFNIFEGLLQNPYFIGISALMSGGQVLIIFVGGAAFSIAKEKQSGGLWAIALVLGVLSILVGALIRLIPDKWVVALVPEFLKRRASKLPGVKVSDEEMGLYPEPLAEVRDELRFLRRMKGGRLNNLKFAVQHPREAIIQRSRSPSRSRSDSLQPPPSPAKGGTVVESGPATPESRRRSRSTRSRSNSALGAPTVMAGIVAAGVAAGWSPTARGTSEGAEDNGEARPRRGSADERNSSRG